MSNLPSGYAFRPVTAADAEILAHHRAVMFLGMGRIPESDVAAFVQVSIPWFQSLLDQQLYAGVLVLQGDEIVCGGGIQIYELAPLPGTFHIGRWGHIINIYTEPEHRRRGLARGVMLYLLEWLHAEKFDRITLTASNEGRPLYASLGFTPTNDMELLPAVWPSRSEPQA